MGNYTINKAAVFVHRYRFGDDVVLAPAQIFIRDPGVNPLQYLGIVEGSPSSESTFPHWDEIAYPHWEDDDSDHIPYGVDTLQYLGITN